MLKALALLAWTVGVAASLGLAAPTHADTGYIPSPGDDQFIQLLNNAGVTYTDKGLIIIDAHALCAYLAQPGASTAFSDAGQQVLKMFPDWTAANAGSFVGAATLAYCPA